MSLPSLPMFSRALSHAEKDPSKIAIVDVDGKTFTYGDLMRDVDAFRAKIREAVGGEDDIQGARIAGLLPPGYAWLVAQWATWASGGLFVPILHTHPVPEMEYIVQKSGAKLLIAAESFAQRGGKAEELVDKAGMTAFIPLALSSLPSSTSSISSHASSSPLPTLSSSPFDASRNAFMLFTSGSTGRPKGVPMAHSALESQVESMTEVWGWSENDRILHVLPMHHIHGTVNVLLTSLWNGATCEFMPKFDAEAIWNRFLSPTLSQLSLFMAVPTIYSRLLDVHATFPTEKQASATTALSKFRLMVSGSAPLPSILKSKWEKIGGGVLLERYGMTETGMIISCGLDVKTRVDGHVGYPMPGVTVRLISPNEPYQDVSSQIGEAGEVQVLGSNIFQGYWEDPETTAKEFVVDEASGERWFRTGDIGVRDSPEEGGFRVLGRSSVDIIKSGGEKISALEIERSLLNLPSGIITDCAVLAVPDEKWGEVVSAVVVLSQADGEELAELKEKLTGEGGVKALREMLRGQLAAYKLPQKLKIYEGGVPRNAMGKVNKKELVKTAFPQ